MPRYEVRIPGPSPGSFEMTLTVEADHWMAALHLAFEELGDTYALAGAVCEVGDDDSVQVTDAGTGRRFFVRQVAVSPKSRPIVPAEAPEDLAEWLGLDPFPDVQAPTHDDAPTRREITARVRKRAVLTGPKTPSGRRRTLVGSGALNPFVRSEDRKDPEAMHVALATLDAARCSAEQLIDRAVELVWSSLECDMVQCLLPQRDGEGWRIVCSRGTLASRVLLARILFSKPPLAAWAGGLERAIHVASPGLSLRYEARDGSPIEHGVDQVAMIPVHDGRRELAMLFVAGSAAHDPFPREVLDALSEVAGVLGRALSVRM